jgi:salicylate hydroxylase
MMPHQSQGACQAIEDSGALGLIFSSANPEFTGSAENINHGLALYEKVRKPRATRVQAASARAMENLNERAGFTSLKPTDDMLKAKQGMLTTRELNEYRMEDHVRMVVEKFRSGEGLAA